MIRCASEFALRTRRFAPRGSDPRTPARQFAPALAFVLAITGGCADSGQRFSAKYSPGYVPGHESIAVLGVFQRGRMNADAWTKVGERLSPAFGSKMCEAAYDDPFRKSRPQLFAELDDSVRADGITEEMLDKVGRFAKASEILVIYMDHWMESVQERAGGYGQRPMSAGRGMRGGRPMAAGSIDTKRTPSGAVEISAAVFAVPKHEFVAEFTMRYSGENVSDALDKFVAKLRAELPSSSCAGWDWARNDNIEASAVSSGPHGESSQPSVAPKSGASGDSAKPAK